MSHIPSNIETKIPKSFSSNYLNFSTPYDVLTSPRHSDLFSKTKSSHRPNTNGQPSVVLYRKTDKLPHKFDLPFKESGYITDGGIHKKKQRYINSQSPKHTFTSSNTKIKPLMCSKSMRSVKKQQNTHLILMTTCPSVNNISSHNKIFTSISSGMNNKHYVTSPKVKTTSVISSSSNKKLTLSPSNQSNSIKHGASAKTKMNKKHSSNTHSNKHHPQIQTYRGLKLSSPSSSQQHENEEYKNDKKNFLIQRDIQQLIRDTQPTNNNERLRKEIDRKTLILNDNGVYIKNIDQILNGETPSQSERSRLSGETISNISNHQQQQQPHQQQQRPTIKQIHLKNKTHKYITHTNTNTTRPMLSSPSRQVLKPKIDNFEFCHQIHLHQKIKAKSKKQKSNNKININSSFRECVSKPHHISGTTSSLIDSKVREVRDSENEYLFSHKKVYKSQENIQKYIKTKRKKELILEENKIQQKNKRILNNYKELYNIGNMRRLLPPKKKKVKHTKHKQHYKYKYMCSNVNLSTIIDEDKLKDEVFKVQNIIYKDNDDIILSSGMTNTNGVIAHNNNVLSHSNSNTTTGSEQHQQEEMVHGGNMKNLIKKVKNTIKQNEIVNNKAMMNQLLLNSHETTSDENEQLNEEDLLTSNNNNNNNDKQYKHTLHSKSEKTPRSITTSNNVHINTNKHHSTNTSKHSSKPNINIQINTKPNNNNNKCTTSDIAVTKDKNIPSLSHSYINTNQNNQHIDIGIEPRCVLNLVEILKILTQRKVFFFLYDLYLNEITIYRYNIAFSYFIAIIKQNAFLAIDEYGTYKTDYYMFIKLFTPFLRRHFTFFVNQCHYRRKVEHLVATLLKQMKLTFLERVYFYGYARVRMNNIIKSIYKALTRPYLVSAFERFVYNVNIVNTCSNVNVSANNYSSGNYSELYYMSLNKNNTYMYESFSSESYSIDPNSEDSPKLHTLFRMVESFAQRRGEEFDGEIDLSVLKENAKERVWKNAAKMKRSDNGSGSGKKGEKERSGKFSKDKEMQIEINIEPDIDVYGNGNGGKQQFNSEQDVSVDKDKEHSNIDWVLNVPSESKSKDNTGNNSINSSSNNNTNEKPKLKIITEPSKESLFPITKQIANNNNNSNNNSSIKPKNTSDLIIEELPYNNILSPPPSQTKQQTPPHTNNTTNIINSPSSLFTNINLSSLTDIITTELLTSLLSQEITNTKLIPQKRFNPLPNPNNSLQLSQSGSLTSSSLNNLTPSDKLTSSPKNISTTNIAYINPLTDNNLLAAYSSSSVFNRSIKEKKKEQSLTFYTNYIAPHLITLIKHEIITNYDNILSNISSPLKTNPHELITALVLEDADLLRNNYRLSQTTTTINDILNKQHLLTKFAPINMSIRQQSSSKPQITSTEQARDDMLNSCIIDAAIELINKERKYGEAGEPLPWSSRMRDIQFKYDKAHPHKLAAFIERKLYEMLNDKIGMINDNYEYLSQEQVNVEREGKLIETIRNELKESEAQWSNLEIQETQIKLEITDMIIDQLYNEVVEILEHIQFNRKRPDLYQFKSIYACEEIPRLSFQITTTGEENENEDDNDIINMEEQLH